MFSLSFTVLLELTAGVSVRLVAGGAEAWLAAIIEATATKRICLIGITSSASNGSLCELTDLDGEKLCSKSYT